MVNVACLVTWMALGASATLSDVTPGPGSGSFEETESNQTIFALDSLCYTNIPLSPFNGVNTNVYGCAAANVDLNPKESKERCDGTNSAGLLVTAYAYYTKCCHWDPVNEFCHAKKLDCSVEVASMNNLDHKGCDGARNKQGDTFNQGYCSGIGLNNAVGQYEWHKQCCEWDETTPSCKPTTKVCSDVSTSSGTINGYGPGCHASRYQDGEFTDQYCLNKLSANTDTHNQGTDYQWHYQCCAWNGRRCIPNALALSQSSSSSSGLSGGEIAAIVVGSIAVVALVFYFVQKRYNPFKGAGFTQLAGDDYL